MGSRDPGLLRLDPAIGNRVRRWPVPAPDANGVDHAAKTNRSTGQAEHPRQWPAARGRACRAEGQPGLARNFGPIARHQVQPCGTSPLPDPDNHGPGHLLQQIGFLKMAVPLASGEEYEPRVANALSVRMTLNQMLSRPGPQGVRGRGPRRYADPAVWREGPGPHGTVHRGKSAARMQERHDAAYSVPRHDRPDRWRAIRPSGLPKARPVTR